MVQARRGFADMRLFGNCQLRWPQPLFSALAAVFVVQFCGSPGAYAQIVMQGEYNNNRNNNILVIRGGGAFVTGIWNNEPAKNRPVRVEVISQSEFKLGQRFDCKGTAARFECLRDDGVRTTWTRVAAANTQTPVPPSQGVTDLKEKLIASERARKEAEVKLAAEAEARKTAELKAAAEAEARRVAEQKQASETARQAELRVAAEAEAKLAAGARQQAELKAAAEAEARRVAEQKQASEAARQAESRAAAEADARKQAELRAANEAEARRVAEQKQASEAVRQAELRTAAEIEARKQAELRAAAEAEARKQAERKTTDEAEARRITEQRQANEAARQAELRLAAEAQARKQAELRAAAEAEARKQAELKAAAEAEARRAAEQKQASEAVRQAELRTAAEAEARRQADLRASTEANARRQAESDAITRRRIEGELLAQGNVLREQESRLSATEREAADARRTAEGARGVLGNILLPVNENPDSWMLRVSAIPVQQQQFCRIVDRFHNDLEAVYKARNDIRRNALYRQRLMDFASLLPRGEITNWIVKVVEVTQAPDGSAAVALQLPCRAMLGSDACRPNSARFSITIPRNSSIYRELERVETNDFVAISGTIILVRDGVPDRPLPQYAAYQPGTHCSAAEGGKSQDMFITDVKYLVRLN